MEGNKLILNYVFKGVVIGFFFPILAVFIIHFILIDESFSLITFHKKYPLLWIIDTAPVVLGAISYFVGNNVSKANRDYMLEIRKTNKELEHLNQEKEVLLREIHHRVKNNLQVITSLLSLQAGFIEDENTKALFRYSQYRINSMAMIHKILYQSKDISKIDYESYAHELIYALITAMKGTKHNIKVNLNTEKIYLNIDTAIPLGLLINEIITNALKYGLTTKEGGTIHFSLKKIDMNKYLMEIGDDGIGFSDEINFRSSNSLGLMLIHKLVLQLNGNIEKNNNMKGTNYIVSFEEIDQTS